MDNLTAVFVDGSVHPKDRICARRRSQSRCSIMNPISLSKRTFVTAFSYQKPDQHGVDYRRHGQPVLQALSEMGVVLVIAQYSRIYEVLRLFLITCCNLAHSRGAGHFLEKRACIGHEAGTWAESIFSRQKGVSGTLPTHHTTSNRVILADEAEHRLSCRLGCCRLCFLPACRKGILFVILRPPFLVWGRPHAEGAV